MTLAARCRPVALVLVEIADLDQSRLEPVDGAEALLDLVPNVLLTEPAASQAHLDALGDLVGSVPCPAFAGRDLGHLAALVGALADWAQCSGRCRYGQTGGAVGRGPTPPEY